MAENQERADGWSGHRSTTVCLVSGECSSSCLREEIRKVKTALTSLLSLDGCWDFYTAQPLMNKFLLNIENVLLALSGGPNSTQFNLNSWFWKPNVTLLGFSLNRCSFVSSTWILALRMMKWKRVEIWVDSSQFKTRRKHCSCILCGPYDTMLSPTKFP